MGQLNLHMSPVFEQDLLKFMKDRNITTKSAAIRLAIHECLEHDASQSKKTDFLKWAGAANNAPTNPQPKFNTDDDLWK
jgi:hypothetical protein